MTASKSAVAAAGAMPTAVASSVPVDGETVEGAPFRRYASWDDAEAGHATAVRRVRELQKQRQGRK